MIILDKPYTSDELVVYLEETQTPVLRNGEAEAAAVGRRLNLLSGEAFARGIDDGKRLYTTSENALDWVNANIREDNIVRGVRCMKDKFLLREALKPLYPDYFYASADYDELSLMDVPSLPYPFVLKPVVGFFSVGVHVVNNEDDWRTALAAIATGREKWRAEYPPDVVGDGRFILEEYIRGEEYALDVYFDNDGKAVIVNIMKHDFSSVEDVSDRLYYTGASVVRDNLARFGKFMDDANAILRLRNFPVHVELRVDGGRILPIEFNPLRFAGWCTTELAWFAYGVRTYDYYLRNRTPDWDEILTGKENDLYSLVILDKRAGTAPGVRLDYEAAGAGFTEVMRVRRVETPDAPIFGFLFTRTPVARRAEEMDAIMRSDLSEFVVA